MTIRAIARRITNYSVHLDFFGEQKYVREPSKFDAIQKQAANKVYDLLMTSGSRKWYETINTIKKALERICIWVLGRRILC